MRYQKHNNYQSSHISWIGDIPTGWEIKRLKCSVSLVNDKHGAKDSELEYVGLEHIESWTGKRIEDEEPNSEGLGAKFLIGDVLFGKLRPYLAKVYLAEREGLATTEALVLRSNNEVNCNYLKYYLLSKDFVNIVDSYTYGAKMRFFRDKRTSPNYPVSTYRVSCNAIIFSLKNSISLNP